MLPTSLGLYLWFLVFSDVIKMLTAQRDKQPAWAAGSVQQQENFLEFTPWFVEGEIFSPLKVGEIKYNLSCLFSCEAFIKL